MLFEYQYLIFFHNKISEWNPFKRRNKGKK